MTLAFYHAKIGDREQALIDLKTATALGASDLESQFTKVQALALLERREESLELLLWCIDKGISPLEVNYALDLSDLRSDARYLQHMKVRAAKDKR